MGVDQDMNLHEIVLRGLALFLLVLLFLLLPFALLYSYLGPDRKRDFDDTVDGIR